MVGIRSLYCGWLVGFTPCPLPGGQGVFVGLWCAQLGPYLVPVYEPACDVVASAPHVGAGAGMTCYPVPTFQLGGQPYPAPRCKLGAVGQSSDAVGVGWR